GSARLASTAEIDGSLVVVGGSAQAADGAKVREDVFVGGGEFDTPAGFTPGGTYVAIGSTLLGGYLQGVMPWLTRGLLLGRPIVPWLPWVWTIAAIFFLVNLLLNVVFDTPVRAATVALRVTPLSAFMTGLLVMLLAGPVCLLLAVSVIGIAVVPFVVCALLMAALLGKVAFARWIGMSVVHQEDPASRSQSTRSFLIGSAIMCVCYMIPVIGFVTWTMAGVFGLGASMLAFLSAYRRENPKPPRKVKVPISPNVAPAPLSVASDAEPAPAMAMAAEAAPSVVYAVAAPAADEPLYAAVTAPAAPAQAAIASELLLLPRATFMERFAAFALDVILIAITVQVLDFNRQEARVGFLLALAYHVTFWTLKGTTLGGIICQLRLVRVDGAPVGFPDALVRGLTGIFSLAVLGLGFLWILKDPDRQAWHDRVAGTYVVKVPRSWPI
ncbi:MAG: RDD family protein, partial [Vicinamibacterales bacterium]